MNSTDLPIGTNEVVIESYANDSMRETARGFAEGLKK